MSLMPLSVWCDGRCRITDQFTQAGRLIMFVKFILKTHYEIQASSIFKDLSDSEKYCYTCNGGAQIATLPQINQISCLL